jgi:Flp pilus assembly protein TadD
LEACAAYRDAIKLTGNDPVLDSKLGYTEVRLGRTQEGVARLKQAVERAPEALEIRERLMKALIAANSISDAAEHAEQLANLEGSARAYLRAASVRAHAKQHQQAQDVLRRGLALFPDSAELRRALGELQGRTGVEQPSKAASQAT